MRLDNSNVLRILINPNLNIRVQVLGFVASLMWNLQGYFEVPIISEEHTVNDFIIIIMPYFASAVSTQRSFIENLTRLSWHAACSKSRSIRIYFTVK